MKSDEVKLYDVGTVEEFRRRGFTAETRPVIHIEPQQVPDTLRHLIPLAERWAIACDVRRADYFDKQPEQDIRDFWIAVQPHCQEINHWLDSMPASTKEWPEAAIHFMYMLKAHSEAIPPEEVARLREERQRNKNQ
ncbi:MAG: hypothetical protein WCS42_02640 [Verrucomicrobiota bacterium]